jgi:preprotein translocase subunit YajC
MKSIFFLPDDFSFHNFFLCPSSRRQCKGRTKFTLFHFRFHGHDHPGILAFLYSPAGKKGQDPEKFCRESSKGDKVVTIAGIHGTINKVNEDGTINLEVSPGSYMKIEKSAISMDWTNQLNKVGTPEKK